MKTALITGSSRGIGRAVARELAHQGWSVGINYLTREDKARELVEELRADGCSAAAVQADVADGAKAGGDLQPGGAGGEQRRRGGAESVSGHYR